MLIYITDDGVVLEAVPKEDCKGCYFWEKDGDCNCPIAFCYFISWKPITDKTKKLLKKEL